jgi:transposase InsO family protein
MEGRSRKEDLLMPWKETRIMNERMRFIVQHENQESNVSELCRQYRISRKTAYKWLGRYEAEGPVGLEDRSRAPKTQARAVSPEAEELLLAARAAHPLWGPRKLKAWLLDRSSGLLLPAPSTIGALLKRHGLTIPRKRLRHATPSATPLSQADAPNHTWCIDFKGWFKTGDGKRCDPLTISDAYSRYLLRCQASAKTDGEHVRALCEAAFREFGLPLVIRSDNGPPFASTGLGGLSRLSVWWIRLGITPERIAPGKPQENGRHERLHLTLKLETVSPPAASGRAQQQAFDHFRREYNEERPHEALGLTPPARLYTASPRPFPARLKELAYPDDWTTRAVRGSGQIKWGGLDVRVSEALIGERVGLEPIENGLWRVWFAQAALGWFDERRLSVGVKRPAAGRRK